MSRDRQTIILETVKEFHNPSTTLEVCEKVIDNYIKETFSGLTNEEILTKVELLTKLP